MKSPALVLLGLILGSCAGTTNQQQQPEAGAPTGNVVEVAATDGFAFDPPNLTVTVGTTVRWTNPGVIPHTVTSGASSRTADDPGAALDGKLPSGGTVEFTFTTPGAWPYFCRYHEGMGMVGSITVTAAQ